MSIAIILILLLLPYFQTQTAYSQLTTNDIPATMTPASDDARKLINLETPKDQKEAPNQEDGQPSQSRAEKVSDLRLDINMDATMTLAELYEILIKINQDLDERIEMLEDEDQKEIAKILRKKQDAIITYLQKIDGVNEETIGLYLAQTHPKKESKYKWPLIGGVCITSLALLWMASYNPKDGLDLPSFKTFTFNKDRLIGVISRTLGIDSSEADAERLAREAAAARAAEAARIAREAEIARVAHEAEEAARVAEETARAEREAAAAREREAEALRVADAERIAREAEVARLAAEEAARVEREAAAAREREAAAARVEPEVPVARVEPEVPVARVEPEVPAASRSWLRPWTWKIWSAEDDGYDL